MLLRPGKKCGHILPFSDFEPLPLYNHVHIPVTNMVVVKITINLQSCDSVVCQFSKLLTYRTGSTMFKLRVLVTVH